MRAPLLLIGLLCSALAPAQRMKVTDLSPSTKPRLVPGPLVGLKAVSVSEYTFSDGNLPLRVFRYTYAANFEAEVARLEGVLNKEHWLLDRRRPGSPATFRRESTLGAQRLSVNTGKWIRADGRPLNTRMHFPKGEKWVRISYNEPGALARPVR